jgi:hypothetical protein
MGKTMDDFLPLRFFSTFFFGLLAGFAPSTSMAAA